MSLFRIHVACDITSIAMYTPLQQSICLHTWHPPRPYTWPLLYEPGAGTRGGTTRRDLLQGERQGSKRVRLVVKGLKYGCMVEGDRSSGRGGLAITNLDTRTPQVTKCLHTSRVKATGPESTTGNNGGRYN